MPTAKIILDTRSKTKKGYPLKLWISHKKHTRMIPLNVWCQENQFDKSKVKVTGIDQSVKITNIIRAQKAKTELYFAENNCKPLSCQELKEKLEALFAGKKVDSIYLSEYVSLLQDRLKSNGQHKTAQTYENALQAVISFRKNPQVIDIDVSFLEDFKSYLNTKTKKSKGKYIHLSKNTVSMYLRALRAIINKARKEDIIPKSFRPFDDVQIPSGKSKKTALDLGQLKLIKNAMFISETPMWNHRNYFFFMFYCRGMNFKDMAFATKDQINGDYLIYEREKTGNEFRVYLLPAIKSILGLYNCERFLFPIMRPDIDLKSEQALKDKDQALHVHNNYLKKIAKNLSIDVNMTSYVARHTYVNIAQLKGYDPKQVSESLGHSDSKITEKHYWPDANQGLIDEMNEKIVSL